MKWCTGMCFHYYHKKLLRMLRIVYQQQQNRMTVFSILVTFKCRAGRLKYFLSQLNLRVTLIISVERFV